MVRRLLSSPPSLLLLCLALAGLVPVGRADGQTAAPEVAAPVTDAVVPRTSNAPTPRQQAWLSASIDERVRLAEALGEDGARAVARSRGYTPLLDGTERSLRQGLDQVYRAADGTVHVFEAKGGGSPLGRAYGFEQGTPEWAVKSARRVATSMRATPAEKAAARAVLEAARNGRLEVHIVRTRHVLGEPIAAVLERSLGCTDEAARLATTTLDDLARISAGTARGAASTAEAAAPATEAAATASRSAPKVIGTVAKGAVVVGAGVDLAVRVHEGTEIEGRFARGELDQEGREVEHARNIAGMAGGWGGALAGAKLGAVGGGATGAAFGGIGAPIGAAAGGLAGGAVGYFGGEAAAEAAAEWTVHQVHAAGTTISEATGKAVMATTEAASAAKGAVRNAWSRATGW